MDSDAELVESDTLGRLKETLLSTQTSSLQSQASSLKTPDSPLAAVAPAIYLDAERKEPWFLGGYYIRGLYCDRERGKVESENPEYLSTCVSLWRKDVVGELGGFDPALPYGFEDNDLSLRVLQSGRRFEVLQDCAARHHLSDTSRIRAETEGWSHFVYDETSRCLIQLKKLGFWGFIKEEAWQWSREGREQRYNIFYETNLRRRQKLLLHTLVPLRAMLAHPFTCQRNRNPDWINAAPIDESRVERIG